MWLSYYTMKMFANFHILPSLDVIHSVLTVLTVLTELIFFLSGNHIKKKTKEITT